MLSEEQRKRVFKTIIVTQCLGMLGVFLFNNGFYLNYFTKLGFSSATFAMLSAIPGLIGGFLVLPFAFLSDRIGKLRLALAGQVMVVASVVLMMAGGWGAARIALPLVILSLLVFCVGGSLQGAGWFALLSPIIPAAIRGRFFGRLRVTFLTVSILFTMLITGVLKITQSMVAFQGLLAVVVLAGIARFFTYARIPELEREVGNANIRKQSFRKACIQVFAIPGYIQFNSYVFLITLLTAGVPLVFGLMQKDVFRFSESQIMLVGNLLLAGNMAGCGLGGRAVDRFGTRKVFFFAHLAYAIVILVMLSRHWMPWPLVVHACVCSFLFSLVAAAAGVAISSEVLALIPSSNRSLSTAVNMSLTSWGIALAGIFVSRSIGSHVFSPEWDFLGQRYSAYDSILFGLTALILIMLAANRLVPKIAAKAGFLPRNGMPRI
jgi:MFS family permease